MNGGCLLAAIVLLCCYSQSVTAEPRLPSSPRPLVLRPISLRTDGSILYRRHQLDPALMRRAAPEEVIERYARKNREENDLITKLNPTGSEPIFFQSGRLRPARYSIVLMRA